MAGFLELENANLSGVALAKPETLVQTDVKWFLSIDSNDLKQLRTPNQEQITPHQELRTYRSIKIDNEEIEFTDGFTDLHTKVYEKTIAGDGFGIEDARDSIELVYKLRNEKVTNEKDTE